MRVDCRRRFGENAVGVGVLVVERGTAINVTAVTMPLTAAPAARDERGAAHHGSLGQP